MLTYWIIQASDYNAIMGKVKSKGRHSLGNIKNSLTIAEH